MLLCGLGGLVCRCVAWVAWSSSFKRMVGIVERDTCIQKELQHNYLEIIENIFVFVREVAVRVRTLSARHTKHRTMATMRPPLELKQP